jgi:STE24 endopeptidase
MRTTFPRLIFVCMLLLLTLASAAQPPGRIILPRRESWKELPDGKVVPLHHPAIGSIPEIIAPYKPREKPEPKPVTLPPARPEIVAYNRTWYALYFLGTAWQFLGLALMVRLRFGPRLRDRVERRTRARLLRAALFYGVFSLLMLLWNLPLGVYAYVFERSYGFATLSPLRWLADRGIGWLFGLLNILAVWFGYLLLERSPRRWWLWLWLASVPWTLTMIVLYPVLIAPAYNTFRPLRNTELRDKLLALASKAGIEGARVYEVDSSRRTTKLNAYVAGLGPTKRIVLWDTTLRALSDDEILAIMGHEMGHYVLGHVWWNFGAGVAGAFVLLWLLSRMLPWAIRRFGPRAEIRSPHDLAGLPLALLLLQLLLFLQTPVESAFSRWQEHQADRYGLELTHLNAPMARAFITFVQRDYADPDPPRFIVFWLSSHPPLRERVEYALNYHPWKRRSKYEKPPPTPPS